MIVAGIPAYNEEKNIAKVILLTQKQVDRVIVCDDGSTDLTGEIARRLGAVVIRHERNLGYGAALQSIFEKAKTLDADAMLTLDADGQHNPEDIPELLKPIQDNAADLVIGSRFLDGVGKDVPMYRRLGIKLITKLSNGTLKGGISDAQSGFRAYSKRAIQSLELQENGMGASAEILLKVGGQNLRVVEASIGIKYKGIESSTHHPLRHGLNVVAAIFRYIVYDRPLDFLGIPGTALFLAGVVMATFFHYQYYMSSPQIFVPSIFFLSIGLVLIGTLAIFTAACARAPKPVIYLVLPGAVSFFVGILLGAWLIQIYMAQQRIVANMGFAAIAFILIGMFTASTATTIIREQSRQENK